MVESVSNVERNFSMARPINIQHDEAVSFKPSYLDIPKLQWRVGTYKICFCKIPLI